MSGDTYDAAVEIREAIIELMRSQSTDKERRRYALLQAAALLESPNPRTVEEAVNRAEKLLAEIEKREKTEAER